MKPTVTARSKKLLQLALTTAGMACASFTAFCDTVFVWGYDSNIVQITSNGVQSVFATNLENWNGPVGLAFDNEGNLYSGCPSNSRIIKYGTNGVVSEVGYIFDSVSALAFNALGILYWSSPNYREVLYSGFTAYTQSHLSYPLALAFDSAGNLFVANAPNPFNLLYGLYFDPHSNSVVRFSSNLTYLGMFATNVNSPQGLAFDSAGNLYVSSAGDDIIYKFTPRGVRSIFAYTDRGPHGVAFDSAGNLFVANSTAGTITKHAPNGSGTVFASGLNSPTSIAIWPGLKIPVKPIVLTNTTALADGSLQFSFTKTAFGTNTVLATTNLSLPLSNWTVLGVSTEASPGQFQFTDPQATNNSPRFYRIKSD